VRAPKFWSNKDSALGMFLAPIGSLYGGVTALRLKVTSSVTAPIPVICVGNVSVGGTGKSPIASNLAERLLTMGRNPAILTGGYGGQLMGPLRVDPDVHSVADVGDEALVHSRKISTWVARHRAKAIHATLGEGIDALIMDDGHQHASLFKTLSILVIDGNVGFGNGRMIPAGPLRERPQFGLARADAVVLMGSDDTNLVPRLPAHIPIYGANLIPGPEGPELKHRKVVAFAGIGNPNKFFDTLLELGALVVSAHTFDDHHLFQESDIQPILDEAFALDAVPVTTEKDAVRLAPDHRQQVNVLSVNVKWDNASAIDNLLIKTLNNF